MNNKFDELKRNTIIIAIANLGSKIMAFVLAPLYSYNMTTSQYGTMDLINSTIGLVLPFVCLDVYEATFRYSSDDNYNKKKVLSTSLVISIPGIIICLIISGLGNFFSIRLGASYWVIVCLCVILGAINFVIAQFLRGSNKMLLFAMSGIVSSLALLVSNLVFLMQLQMGLKGWLLSFFVSKMVETAYLCIASNITKYFSITNANKIYAKEFIKFCLPLMPTTTMWWIMNLSDRYMLAFFLGSSATGIYAVANKLPGLLSIFENIFYQAWQTTAINNHNSNDRDMMYSKVFNNYFSFIIIGLLGILIVSKPLILILFAKDYEEAWVYIPVLVLGVVIHALNGNLGSLYSVFRDTKGALYSTILGAMTNILLNIIFIPLMGIMGAALTTLIGYIVTLIYRWIDTKKFVNIVMNYKEMLVLWALVGAQLFLYYQSGIWSYVLRVIILIVPMIIKKDLLISFLKRG